MGATGQPPPDVAPRGATLNELRDEAAGCRRCGLYRRATQTVFGEGPESADLVVVGEQPGDREDRDGRPFVGPAGRLLDDLLDDAGIDRESTYVTNAVKHFKWIAKGKRRIHQRPDASELAACRPWLEAELTLLEPQVLLCLGATAARAVIGPSFRVTRDRGRFLAGEETRLEDFGGSVTATLHPSALLRIREDDERREATDGVLADLRAVAARLAD
jgi:DNA polymerase